MKRIFYIFVIIIIAYVLIVALASIKQRGEKSDVSTWKIEEVGK